MNDDQRDEYLRTILVVVAIVLVPVVVFAAVWAACQIAWMKLKGK